MAARLFPFIFPFIFLLTLEQACYYNRSAQKQTPCCQPSQWHKEIQKTMPKSNTDHCVYLPRLKVKLDAEGKKKKKQCQEFKQIYLGKLVFCFSEITISYTKGSVSIWHTQVHSSKPNTFPFLFNVQLSGNNPLSRPSQRRCGRQPADTLLSVTKDQTSKQLSSRRQIPCT